MPEPTPTFAEEMLTKVEDLLRKSAGLKVVTWDGKTMQYDDLVAQREKWRREVAQEQGKRNRVLGVDLSGF
ncbi:hypothetical protein [Planctopirus hydrillae]|uniref:Uncharacterized protein n=1 Tax=Planctopirus hydrillae TaxID=1841610 RepID=A0A1C3E4A1_9PLAN|nr:hypothetical protein [Planctopirus hydrillae]ODA28064.1 hypothetical protein A6X21_14480 [Planctopirus hydrillae]